MFKIFTGVLLSAAVSTSAFAQSDPADSSVRITKEGVWYSVARDETLSVIAHRFTGDIRNWRTIGRTNHIDNDRTIPIGRKLLIPARLLAPVSAYATIRAASGKVVIRTGDGANIEAKIGTQLKEGDTLVTGTDSFISLALDDGTQFTLPPESRLNLKLLRTTSYLNSPRTQLYLEKGRVESQVTPFTKPESRYEVISPLAVSGVRGTNFRVNYGDNRVLNEVIEGKVAVQANEKKPHASAAQSIAAGYGNVVENGRARPPIALLSAPSMADGYQLQQRLPIRFTLSQPQAAAFRARVSSDADGDDNIAEANARAVDGNATVKIADLSDGDYYVHYNAVAANGLSGLRNTLRFRVAARPFPPFLQFPGAKYQDSNAAPSSPVQMAWTQVEGVTRYRLQVAQDAAFDRRLVDRIVETSGQESANAIVQLATGTYYWRVASIVVRNGNDRQGPFSDGKQVDVLKAQTSPQVAVEENNVHFSWPATPGQRFTFQVSDSVSFDRLIVDMATEKPEAAIARPDAGTYYARVRSTDDDGFVGAFSPPQEFVIPSYWQTGYGAPLRSQDQPLGTGF